jgi:hypothetical protein
MVAVQGPDFWPTPYTYIHNFLTEIAVSPGYKPQVSPYEWTYLSHTDPVRLFTQKKTNMFMAQNLICKENKKKLQANFFILWNFMCNKREQTGPAVWLLLGVTCTRTKKNLCSPVSSEITAAFSVARCLCFRRKGMAWKSKHNSKQRTQTEWIDVISLPFFWN